MDVALGEHAGLVLEESAGAWCRACSSASILDADDLRERLAAVDFAAPGTLTPSLAYDTPRHPRSVQLEVTTRCNLHCEYCSHRHLEHQEDVPFDLFVERLDRIDFTRVDNVDFTGLGEPALHPRLADMVREVRRRGSPTHLRVVTNGTILSQRRFEALCDAGITSIAFSIDSLDPERFARSRGGARLRKVLDNLEALVEFRARRGGEGPRIRIKSVLLEEPYGEAERLLRYSAGLGLDMPHFSRLDTRGAAQGNYGESWLESSWADDGDDAFLWWAQSRWRELAPDAAPLPEWSAPSLETGEFVHPDVLPGPDLCRWAVDAAFVGIRGQALACCEQMIDLPRVHWGSLDEVSMAALWTGELLWGYRLPLSLGRVPAPCVGCVWAPADGVAMEPRSGRTSLPVLSAPTAGRPPVPAPA
jgi:pyruvate-formate lyase-activating enzyme